MCLFIYSFFSWKISRHLFEIIIISFFFPETYYEHTARYPRPTCILVSICFSKSFQLKSHFSLWAAKRKCRVDHVLGWRSLAWEEKGKYVFFSTHIRLGTFLHLPGKRYWQCLQQWALDYTTYWCFCLFTALRVVIVIWWGPESTMIQLNLFSKDTERKNQTCCFFFSWRHPDVA